MATRRTKLHLALVALAGVLSVSLSMPAASAAIQSTKVAWGLNNPRGIAVVSGRSYFVAEAGKGGSGPCQSDETGKSCIGLTGSVTHVNKRGSLDRLVRLPSIASPDGSFALGPHDVAVGDDGMFVTIGLGGGPDYRAGFGRRGKNLATLAHISRDGHMRVIADLLAYERGHNPDGNEVASDPYGLLRSGEGNIVTDAGANDLLRVGEHGRVKTLAVFPNRKVSFNYGKVPMEAVPTTVVRGPDGALYVGQLTGFPFPRHGARIYRVVPGQQPTIWARGFTNIIDIAFHDGALYVLEIAHNGLLSSSPYGALLRLNADGSKTILDKDLSFPTSLAFVPGTDDVLVTNCGICAGGGEVLRLSV